MGIFQSKDINPFIQEMTLEEKVSFCRGASYFHTVSIPRLNIPSIQMSDGPCGINKAGLFYDELFKNRETEKTILFPCPCCTSCSFDQDLLFMLGETVGEEMIKEGISLILSPAVNIKRSPLCGRNFEYYSEDPFLSSKSASSFIQGVQTKGVGCCIKHFAANNQETIRYYYSSDVDERTFREIYLASFETAIKESKPWAVMSSYNKINDVYAANDYNLLTGILRDEWKWSIDSTNEGKIVEGFVVSDWDGEHDRIEGFKAGLDLKMPGPNQFDCYQTGDEEVLNSLKNKDITEDLIDRSANRILNVVLKAQEVIKKSESDPSIQFGKTMNKVDGMLDRHHDISRIIAENSIVLLKNVDSLLPLPLNFESPSKSEAVILFVGEFAERPHVVRTGSGGVSPYKVSGCLSASLDLIKSKGKNVSLSYVKGFESKEGKIDESSFDQAIEEAKQSDIVVIFAGTPLHLEGETKDQANIKLPEGENSLITKICEVNKNVAIVLQNGSPLEMPWIDDVKAVLETYLCGEAGAEATANILFGLVNPSGHLSESFPIRLEDNPSFNNFCSGVNMKYEEGVFVGYRHYITKNVDVLFPFGHGLSYTTFKYSNIQVVKSDNFLNYTVSVDVKNTGRVDGKTVAQLYVSDLTNEIERPLKELKGFKKVSLKPDEEKTITFDLDKRSFSWWDIKSHDWHVSNGAFQIIIGQSSKDKDSLTLDLQINPNK